MVAHARTDPTGIGTDDTWSGATASWRLAGAEAEARRRVHRRASLGGNFPSHSRRARRSQPISFCACLPAVLRRASTSLPYAPPDGSSAEPAAAIGAPGDPDRDPDWIPRNKFVHEGISQVRRRYTKRISASVGAAYAAPTTTTVVRNSWMRTFAQVSFQRI
jgi:hypothetical protein